VKRCTEKQGGARSVSRYDIRTTRAYAPVWTLRNPKPIFYDADTCARVTVEVDFWDEESAADFQAKILAMMPRTADEK
jgi:hypothetical protein